LSRRRQCEFELHPSLEQGLAFRRPLARRVPLLAFRTMLPSSKFLKLLFVQVQRTRSHRLLSYFNEVPVEVSHVAAQFGCMDFRLGDEFRAARRPRVVAASNVTHAKVYKNA